jgi:hypothetical protein
LLRVASVPALRTWFNDQKAARLLGEVVDQLEVLDTRTADSPALWQPTRSALRAFADSAQSHGIRPVFVLVPSRLQYDDAVWSKLVVAQRLDTAAFARDLPERVLGAIVTHELHAPLIDPLPAYQALGPAAAATYYPIDGHFTARGQQLLGSQLVPFFARSLAGDPRFAPHSAAYP